jgi:hypothetical protein
MQLPKALRLGAAGTIIAAASYLAFTGITLNETAQCWGHLHASLDTTTLSNHPGPYITMSGDFTLGAIDAVLIFRNNEKGTHERTEDVSVRVSLSSPQTIRFNKQPPLGGVGGNPFIFLQLLDDKGDQLTDKILLGRVVQGLLPVDLNCRNFVDVFAQLAGSCSNSPGPFITLDGDLSFRGISARLIFQNSPQPDAPHQRVEAVEMNFALTQPSGSIHFAKQPPLGGVGGNPLIYVRFESGAEVSDEIYLGRCVQLSK